MALDPVPWFIGGGAEHSADVARLVVHVATGGAAGIVGSTDLRVTELPAPTSSVRIAAGAAIIPNTNAFQQSYALRAPSITDLSITPTGSAAGRADMVVAYVDDPQFTGAVLPTENIPFGPYVKFKIIEGVGSTATTVPGSFGFPALPLARINLPINTATVTQGLITDLRKVAMPKRTRDLYNTQPTSTTSVSSGTTVDFCPQSNREITVPSWATQMKVIGTVSGAVNRNADIVASVVAQFGTTVMQSIAVDMGTNTRSTIVVSDTIAIGASARGTTQTLRLRANRTSGSGTLQTDYATTVLWDVEFLEVASAD